MPGFVFHPDGGPGAWADEGLCRQTDPEAFFPEKGGSTKAPKEICERCEVKAECLTFALVNNERFGVWGGMSERTRKRLPVPAPEGFEEAARLTRQGVRRDRAVRSLEIAAEGTGRSGGTARRFREERRPSEVAAA